MKLEHGSMKVMRFALVFLAVPQLVLNFEPMVSTSYAQAPSSTAYQFIVSDQGFTSVKIEYHSSENAGSSWILVPNRMEWTNQTILGRVTQWSLCDTLNLTGGQLYFYQALCFSFIADERSEFQLNIQYNFSTAAMIIEPYGIFYSPQIGFEKGNEFHAYVVFPNDFEVNRNEALALGTNVLQPTFTNSNYVSFDDLPRTENLMRLEIGFRTRKENPEMTTIREGTFTFETVKRYDNYARRILDLYNKTYSQFSDLFNVTLGNAGNMTHEGVVIRFFLPDFDSLLSVGGYVPFPAEKIGDIYINIAFTRFVEGYIEVIALHELVHHFLWKAGISPDSLLWFHEGMAQYASLETAQKLNYEGAKMMKDELENGVSQLIQLLGDKPDLGFLEKWSPSNQPVDMSELYVSAYYVVSRLGLSLGGLQYYANFFKRMEGAEVGDAAMLSYYMSLVANESIAVRLNSWSFDVPDLYTYSGLIDDTRLAVNAVNPVFQPYKFLAELLYGQALSNAGDKGSGTAMQRYLSSSLTVARLAPMLALITWSGLLLLILLLILRRKGVFQDYPRTQNL